MSENLTHNINVKVKEWLSAMMSATIKVDSKMV
jgi:hypothetical protein